jgi:hypothetical protein
MLVKIMQHNLYHEDTESQSFSLSFLSVSVTQWFKTVQHATDQDIIRVICGRILNLWGNYYYSASQAHSRVPGGDLRGKSCAGDCAGSNLAL